MLTVITNCQRTKCDNFNCLTAPCRTTETCLGEFSKDFPLENFPQYMIFYISYENQNKPKTNMTIFVSMEY